MVCPHEHEPEEDLKRAVLAGRYLAIAAARRLRMLILPMPTNFPHPVILCGAYSVRIKLGDGELWKSERFLIRGFAIAVEDLLSLLLPWTVALSI